MAALRVWCGVTGHGFGHFMQVAPILNRLWTELGEMTLHLTAALPRQVMAAKLAAPFTHDPRPRDVGLVQRDPLLLDLEGTLAALRRLYGEHDTLLRREVAEMKAFRPDLVLADIPCVTLEAASLIGAPSVAVASLTWDRVLAAALPGGEEVEGWRRAMRRAYATATLALLPEPALWEGHPFARVAGVGPLVEPGVRRRQALRRELEAEEAVVLVTLGGIPTRRLPLAAMARERRVTWIVDGEVATPPAHVRPLSSLSGWSFPDLVASVDAVVGKPGYGLATLAAVSGTPLLFVRRGWFADEAPIVAWLAERLPVAELTWEAFGAGAWFDALAGLLARARPTPRPGDGPGEAVACLRALLSENGAAGRNRAGREDSADV